MTQDTTALALSLATKTPNISLEYLSNYSDKSFGSIRQFESPKALCDLAKSTQKIADTVNEINNAVLAVKTIIIAATKIQQALRKAQTDTNVAFHTNFTANFGAGYLEAEDFTASKVISRLSLNTVHVEQVQSVIDDSVEVIDQALVWTQKISAFMSQITTLNGVIGLLNNEFPDASEWISEQLDLSKLNTSMNLDHFTEVFSIMKNLFTDIAPAALAIKYNLNYLDFIGKDLFNHTNEDSKQRSEAEAPSSSASSASGSGSGYHGPSIFVDGPNGFLWKPVSESTGKLCIILPEEGASNCDVYRAVLNEDGKTYRKGELLASGDYTGQFDTNRALYRFGRSGESFGPEPVIVQGDKEWLITDPSMRND